MTWFDETLYSEWNHRGYIQRFEISRILHQTKTSQQNLIVFETPMFGRVLAIDGVIQTTERDEFIYHEMLVNHTGSCGHKDHLQNIWVAANLNNHSTNQCVV